MSDQKIAVAVNLLLIKNGSVLLGKRLNTVGAGTYGVPGGHLEYGETLVDAAKRELLEETGVLAQDLEFLHVVTSLLPAHYVHVNFLVKRWQGEITNTEPDKCEGWEWHNLDALPENIFSPNKIFIEAYKDHLQLLEK